MRIASRKGCARPGRRCVLGLTGMLSRSGVSVLTTSSGAALLAIRGVRRGARRLPQGTRHRQVLRGSWSDHESCLEAAWSARRRRLPFAGRVDGPSQLRPLWSDQESCLETACLVHPSLSVRQASRGRRCSKVLGLTTKLVLKRLVRLHAEGFRLQRVWRGTWQLRPLWSDQESRLETPRLVHPSLSFWRTHRTS